MFSLSLLCTQNCFMDEWGEYITIPFSGSTNTGPSDWVECVKPFAQAVKKHDCYRYREGSCKDYCFIMLCSSSGTIKICFAPSHPWNSAPSALCETTLIVNDSDATSTALRRTAALMPCCYWGKTVLKHQPKENHLFPLDPTNAAPQRRQTGTPYGQIINHPVKVAIGKENRDEPSPAVGPQGPHNWTFTASGWWMV